MNYANRNTLNLLSLMFTYYTRILRSLRLVDYADITGRLPLLAHTSGHRGEPGRDVS